MVVNIAKKERKLTNFCKFSFFFPKLMTLGRRDNFDSFM